MIGIENLNLKGMSRGLKLGKSVHDAGIGETVRQLKYKAAWYGRYVHQSSRWYPSSQLCHHGGHRQDMPHGVAVYVCGECGNHWDRDENASINLEIDAVGHTESVNA